MTPEEVKEFEANATCKTCFDCLPSYGLAPHIHIGITDNPISLIGSTKFLPKEEWPDNFVPEEDERFGVYYCPDCCPDYKIKEEK